MLSENKSKLSEGYLPFAERIVRQIMCRFRVPAAYFDDYLGAAYTGLLEALERYDLDSEVPFENYAYLRVRGAVIDYIRQSSGISSREYQAAKLLQASDCLAEDFQQVRPRLGEQDIDESLAEVLDFVAKGALIFRLNYIDCEEELMDEKVFSSSPEEITINKQVQEIIVEALDELPPREKKIIYEYYFEGKTFQEIADDSFKMTRSWISRIHSKALEGLRENIATKLDSLGEIYAR